MTRLCVPIFVQTEEQTRRDIAAALEAGADLVELRLDLFGGNASALVEHSLLPSIATCRPRWEGGHSDASDAERIARLRSLSARPAYVDIELATYRRGGVSRDEVGSLILSAHDFAGRPDRLTNLFAELTAAPCDVVKIVWTARTIRDNLEAFELLRSRQKPTIALCMGEAGLISRILAKKFGGFLTFASLAEGAETAPGQVSIADMKRLYRWDAIGARTRVYGVVAQPVSHSMSPVVHNAAFDAAGYDGVYLPLRVNAGYESFKAFMESFLHAEGLDLSGLSITLPHKENALKYLREKDAAVDPLAASIGAVNTIAIDPAGGSPVLSGTNTDYAAILDSITARRGGGRAGLAGVRVGVIGAGGTGRTAVAALAHCGATVVVYNRTRDRADALAQEFNGHSGKVVAAPIEKLCDSCCEVFINTTSVGMHPNIDASPFGDTPPKLAPDSLVFDAVYNPVRTKLLQQAEAAGARTINGVEMFVRQAAGQFTLWTGLAAPVDVMRGALERRLGVGNDNAGSQE